MIGTLEINDNLEYCGMHESRTNERFKSKKGDDTDWESELSIDFRNETMRDISLEIHKICCSIDNSLGSAEEIKFVGQLQLSILYNVFSSFNFELPKNKLKKLSENIAKQKFKKFTIINYVQCVS